MAIDFLKVKKFKGYLININNLNKENFQNELEKL